jgi:mRNA-degrading endonuclease RelE of RelBE toxin-antitoxin system
MELKFKGQFNRDINIANKNVLEAVRDAIKNVKQAPSIQHINELKKLRKYKTQYRIKVAEDYRIGVVIHNKTVWFVRFGHRNSIYKIFP